MLNPGFRLDDAMTTLVGNVLNSHYNIERGMHQFLMLSATAQTPTTGWHSGQLIPWIYMTEPEDHIMDFDFYGRIPTYFSQLGEGLLKANIVIELPAWAIGYRIHTYNNGIHEVLFGDESSQQSHPSPRYSPYFLEVGRGLSGMLGTSYNSIIYTDKCIFHATKDMQDKEEMEFVREIKEAERAILFDPMKLNVIRKNEMHETAKGFYNFISLKEGDHFHYVLWDTFKDVPGEVLELYQMVMKENTKPFVP
jgi:hypothetical protein